MLFPLFPQLLAQGKHCAVNIQRAGNSRHNAQRSVASCIQWLDAELRVAVAVFAEQQPCQRIIHRCLAGCVVAVKRRAASVQIQRQPPDALEILNFNSVDFNTFHWLSLTFLSVVVKLHMLRILRSVGIAVPLGAFLFSHRSCAAIKSGRTPCRRACSIWICQFG